ncbi:MAG: ABC transporter ATP-binding protein [Streptosporangiaceae bacterium]
MSDSAMSDSATRQEAPLALTAERLTKRFGGVTAVDDCTLTVREGSLTGLIGPNGSGKTTLLNMVSGYVRPDSGQVQLFRRPLSCASPTIPYRRGLSRTFQRARVFPHITVRENLYAAIPHRGLAVLRAGLAPEVRERAESLLAGFGLTARAGVPAGELSYGQQKLLEFATVLMSSPRVLLLDEPTAGVNPVLIDTMVERIRELHAQGVTVVVVEHNMEFVMNLCDTVVVLDHGTALFEGPPAIVQSNALVLSAYLGD